MKTIEIVTHCWRYSRVLAYQLSSLVLHPPRTCRVVIHVYSCANDEPTARIPPAFMKLLDWLRSAIRLRWSTMPQEELLNRAIGRNQAAKQSRADIVWFADCDYVFGEGCLDTLASLDLSGSKLFYPRQTLVNEPQAKGDEYAAAVDPANPRIVDIDPTDFQPTKPGRPHRAIGGIQIVPGDVARQYGYCPDVGKHQRPVKGEAFKRNRSDTTFRRILQNSPPGGTPIDLPNLYRIRQTQFGQVDTLTPASMPALQPAN